MAPLDEEAVQAQLGDVSWEREGDKLVKTVVLADFKTALAWINRVGELAEGRNHHPDINLSWNRVTLTLTTHSVGGLTDADFELARAIDALPS